MSRAPRISQDFLPLSRFKVEASRVLAGLAVSGRPTVITLNGRPAGVLLSPAEYDRLCERERFLDAVGEGLEDLGAGRVQRGEDLRVVEGEQR
jgi:prevent-host-death family protein